MIKKQIMERIEGLNNSGTPREDLLALYEYVKETQDMECIIENKTKIVRFMNHEDPKTRRLAIKLLGIGKCEEYLQDIFEVYRREQTLFVRADYLRALESLSYESLLGELKEQYRLRKEQNVEESLKVHINAELMQLYKMIVSVEGIKEHHFVGLPGEMEILLTTKSGLEDITLRQLMGVKKKRVPGGVMVKTDNLDIIKKIRTYEELLFYFGTIECDECNEKLIAEQLLKLGIAEFLYNSHKEKHPIGLRIQYNCKVDVAKKGDVIRRLGKEIEYRTKGFLFNTVTGYEVELRLHQIGEKKYRVMVKLYTLIDHRFDYRKETLPVSIKPYLAANLVQLALPYLKEGAQIIDPYCGVGTMLIERRMAVQAKDTYGVDQYGEAIIKARENSKQVGPMIHYVQRNYENFTHSYLFDELITNMPTATRKVSREDVNKCYGYLFSQGRNLLKEGGIMVVYGNEHGTMKRLLRINREFSLLKDIEIDVKLQCHLYVIGYKMR